MTDSRNAQHSAVEALVVSEARHKAIFETAVDAMVVIDETARVQSVNPSAERIFGYTADEMLGQNVSMLMPQPHRTAHDGYVSAYRQTGERKIIGIGREVEGRRKDGTLFPLELSIAEWRDSNGRRFFTGIMRDISARRRTELDLLEAKAEAERANLAKSKFLAAASHDLRQPIQSMFLLTASLERHIGSGKGRETLNHLERGLDTLKGLLDSLLDVSRLDANIVQPSPKDFALAELMTQIDSAYAAVATAKGLNWSVEQCSDLFVHSDPTLLGRMIRNLTENAVRYTPAGGRVKLECNRNNGAVQIVIADTGIGIPPEHLERIWDEFHQVGNQARNRAEGLGLGLAIVRRLSRLLGHPVSVNSTPGEGSVFALEVTLATTRPVALQVDAPIRSPDAQGRLALLLDDDAIVLLGLKAMFEDWGFEVLAAGSVDQAQSLLRSQCRVPDVIVSDYRLQDGQVGTEAVRQLRMQVDRKVPGILLTGETGNGYLAAASALDIRVIHKPVTARQLSAALDNCLRES